MWQLVAVHRLFALSTIRSHLSRQSALFEKIEDRWFMTGDTVFKDVVPAPSRSQESDNSPEAKLRARARDLARQLASVLNQINDDALREETVASLGLVAVSPSAIRDLELACEAFMADGTPAVLAAIERTIKRHPDRAGIVASWLNNPLRVNGQHEHQLIEVVERYGSSTAVARVNEMRDELRAAGTGHAPSGPLSPDLAEVAYEELLDGTRRLSDAASVITAAYESVSGQGVDTLFECPADLLDSMVRLERIRMHDSTGVTDLDIVTTARQALLAAAVAALGDTDRHASQDRQQALAIARLLQGDVDGVLDVMKEYGFLLRELGNPDDAAAVFTAADRFARAQGADSSTARLIGREAADATCSEPTGRFLAAWCEIAKVANPALGAGVGSLRAQ